ncbi:MAG: class II aldolase/adducin family protein [Paracoccaceae bacterium]
MPPDAGPERTLRQAMIDTCRAMEAKGINQGTSGNLSLRHGAGLLITPSSLPYDRMQPEDIVQMAWDGSHTGRRPSSEWRFHRDILQARADINVVLHCHSPHATAVASHHRDIPAFHYMVGVMGGDSLRCAPYETFGTAALSVAALAALQGRMACLLGQHGQIALGRTLDAALAMAVEVETLAQIYLAALVIGEPPVLSAAEMSRVIARMTRMSYGQAPEEDSPA